MKSEINSFNFIQRLLYEYLLLECKFSQFSISEHVSATKCFLIIIFSIYYLQSVLFKIIILFIRNQTSQKSHRKNLKNVLVRTNTLQKTYFRWLKKYDIHVKFYHINSDGKHLLLKKHPSIILNDKQEEILVTGF